MFYEIVLVNVDSLKQRARKVFTSLKAESSFIGPILILLLNIVVLATLNNIVQNKLKMQEH